MGSQGAGIAQPSGRIDHPYHSDESRLLTETRGRSPNLAPSSSAIAAPAVPTAAAAKSDTAKTEGSSPGSMKSTLAATSAPPPIPLHIAVRNSRVKTAALLQVGLRHDD